MSIFSEGLNIAKKWVSKIGIILGFTAATAVGILGGIDAALMFPSMKLILGFFVGGSSCFVNAVSYFYVVSQSDATQNRMAQPKGFYKNTFGSTIFAGAATFFIGTTFVANFVGMYIGFTVLGGKLDLNWPDVALQAPGGIFGVASAVSGLIFNVKIAGHLWNKIRFQDIDQLPPIQRPLLINNSYDDTVSNNLSSRKINRKLNQLEIVPIVQLSSEENFAKFPNVQQIKSSFLIQRGKKTPLPKTENINERKRSYSL